ncbi:hypothetical protein FGE12_18305 [Aggregicoccus sp. 17bor-14]|uniref:BatD family protein n=1 Tax=Myxococcaceae TaxID=31 RepID=UPI00129CB2EF|nr:MULTISPECIES: BatD family protein [Myxococcaceae]MBF5044357.1 hypothetical protein [Simulacricoccus sp. 17bor-14]MRI90104.1 hypothetical protein [Aggregicoccus sp. 17bor-14]
MSRPFALLAALLLCLPALAQPDAADAGAAQAAAPRSVHASVQPAQVLLGEPFTYELVVAHAAEQRWELALPKELGAFEVLEQQRQREDAPKGGAGPVTTFRLKLAAYELGKLTLPRVTLEEAAGGAGHPGHFTPEPQTVEVRSTLGDDAAAQGAQLEDLKAPAEVAVRSWRLVWGLLAVLALGLGAWLLARVLARRHAAVPPPPPPLPLVPRTHQALRALQAEHLPEQGRGREFYFRLSDILRGYLGERFSFEALECTSSELLLALRPRAAGTGLPLAELERFVAGSDLVKYAKSEPPAPECDAALAFAHALVDRTGDVPPPPSTPSAAHASGPDVP